MPHHEPFAMHPGDPTTAPGFWAWNGEKRKVTFSCPRCAQVVELAPSHEVIFDGTIYPALECPCGWGARWLTLEGWDPFEFRS